MRVSGQETTDVCPVQETRLVAVSRHRVRVGVQGCVLLHATLLAKEDLAGESDWHRCSPAPYPATQALDSSKQELGRVSSQVEIYSDLLGASRHAQYARDFPPHA